MTDRNWTRAAWPKRVTARYGRDGERSTIAFVEMEDEAGKRRTAAKSMHVRGIPDMHARGRISDAQHAAHEHFERLYEQACADGLGAIDYSRVHVDGGAGGGYGAIDRTMKARDRLAAIRKVVGAPAFRVLELASGQGLAVSEVRTKMPANDNGRFPSQPAVSKLIKDALGALATYLADPGAKPGMVRAEAYGKRATMAEWIRIP